MNNLWVLVSGGQGTLVREYPYSPAMHRAKLLAETPGIMLPSIDAPEFLERERIMPVTPSERPAYHPSKVITEANPKRIDGIWTQQWVETDADLPTTEQLVSYTADQRWEKEVGGVTLNGTSIATDRSSQAMIAAAYSYSEAHPEEMIRFKAASGWVDLDALTMAVIASAVGAHVQACFATEAEVAAGIDAGTITTYAQVEEAFA